MEHIQQMVNERKAGWHIGFCVIIIALFLLGNYLRMPYIPGGPASLKLVTEGFFVLSIYAGRWLCIKWFFRNQPFRLWSYSILLSAVFTFVIWLCLKCFVPAGPYFDLREFILITMPFLLTGMAGGVFTKIFIVTLQNQAKQAAITAEQKQSELHLLQSQLSPHFLFNTLNNLYGISIAQHERMPGLLLKLSDLLRYTVYDTKKPFVPLQEELEYIHNYIDFESIRISDRLLLHTDIAKVDTRAIKIAPMVLIVFIENAFKHAKNTWEQKISVSISLIVSGDFILFSIRNSYRESIEGHPIVQEQEGIGVANTLKRLDLLYGKEFCLHQNAENEVYTVDLRLKIQ